MSLQVNDSEALLFVPGFNIFRWDIRAGEDEGCLSLQEFISVAELLMRSLPQNRFGFLI